MSDNNYQAICTLLGLPDTEDTFNELRDLYIKLEFIGSDQSNEQQVKEFICSDDQLQQLKNEVNAESDQDLLQIKNNGIPDDANTPEDKEKRWTTSQLLTELDIKPSELNDYLKELGLKTKRTFTQGQVNQIKALIPKNSVDLRTNAGSLPDYSDILNSALEASGKEVEQAILASIQAENTSTVQGVMELYRRSLRKRISSPEFLVQVRSEAATVRAQLSSSSTYQALDAGSDTIEGETIDTDAKSVSL